MKTLAQRIEAAQEQLLGFKDKLVEQEKLLDSDEEGVAEGAMLVIKELADNVDTSTEALNVLKRAESALSSKAAPVAKSGSPAIIPAAHLGSGEKNSADLLVSSAACTMEAYLKRVPVEQVMEERYADNDAVKAVMGMVNKSAQNPAMTSVAGWAAELTRESYAAFMELLQAESVVPQLPLERHDFGNSTKITLPSRKATPKDPNLAAAFRAEGDPIRVGAATTGKAVLTPKSMAVIGTFTMELFKRSTPNIESAIRKWMIEDTAVALDEVFLGSAPGTAIQPAGLQTYATSGNTAASAGPTAANIVADLRGRLQAMTAAGMGRRPVWIMNPARAYGVSLSINATGTLAFPEMANGVLVGIPVVTSVNVPADVVFLVDAAEVSFAGGAPEFMGTEVATIHEEGVQADVKPIVGAGTGTAGATDIADVPNPVRSLYQTYSAALRAVWEIDWVNTRPAGSVQTLTAVSW